MNDVAYKISLPEGTRIHNVFHVNLLKPYLSDGRVQLPPPPVEIDGEMEYTVNSILAHRDRRYGRSTRREYLVSWEGYGPEHNTWDPESNLANCPDILRVYKEARALLVTAMMVE